MEVSSSKQYCHHRGGGGEETCPVSFRIESTGQENNNACSDHGYRLRQMKQHRRQRQQLQQEQQRQEEKQQQSSSLNNNSCTTGGVSSDLTKFHKELSDLKGRLAQLKQRRNQRDQPVLETTANYTTATQGTQVASPIVNFATTTKTIEPTIKKSVHYQSSTIRHSPSTRREHLQQLQLRRQQRQQQQNNDSSVIQHDSFDLTPHQPQEYHTEQQQLSSFNTAIMTNRERILSKYREQKQQSCHDSSNNTNQNTTSRDTRKIRLARINHTKQQSILEQTPKKLIYHRQSNQDGSRRHSYRGSSSASSTASTEEIQYFSGSSSSDKHSQHSPLFGQSSRSNNHCNSMPQHKQNEAFSFGSQDDYIYKCGSGSTNSASRISHLSSNYSSELLVNSYLPTSMYHTTPPKNTSSPIKKPPKSNTTNNNLFDENFADHNPYAPSEVSSISGDEDDHDSLIQACRDTGRKTNNNYNYYSRTSTHHYPPDSLLDKSVIDRNHDVRTSKSSRDSTHQQAAVVSPLNNNDDCSNFDEASQVCVINEPSLEEKFCHLELGRHSARKLMCCSTRRLDENWHIRDSLIPTTINEEGNHYLGSTMQAVWYISDDEF